ncbi:MAG: fatty acid desaturase, partial [Nanoarchaeota archaeon]|nr:fatty acid desaturase [Nanoarchaeota archaeon]
MKKEQFNWRVGGFLIGLHVLIFTMVPWFLITRDIPKGMILATIGLICACSMSITAGYHRLYSHRAYKTHSLFEVVILFFGSASIQGSAVEWSENHRAHHRYVDTEKDPYTVKDGFWHAHMLWLLRKQKSIDESKVADLLKNPLTAFQHKYFDKAAIATNVIIVLTFGYLFSSYLAAFVIMFLARLFFTYHTTWFINSLA